MDYNSWAYKLNGKEFMTIEAVNTKGERVWIKFVPVNPQEPINVANILDRPDEVKWSIKNSHIEEIGPDDSKRNYLPAVAAGSVCVTQGTTIFSKDPNTEVYIFPLDPLEPQRKLNECRVSGHANVGSTFTVSVDASTWLGYATNSGTIDKATV